MKISFSICSWLIFVVVTFDAKRWWLLSTQLPKCKECNTRDDDASRLDWVMNAHSLVFTFIFSHYVSLYNNFLIAATLSLRLVVFVDFPRYFFFANQLGNVFIHSTAQQFDGDFFSNYNLAFFATTLAVRVDLFLLNEDQMRQRVVTRFSKSTSASYF